MNLAFLAKLGWQIMTNEKKLWVEVIWGMYWRHDGYKVRSNVSHTWRSILKGLKVARQGLGWRIGNSRTVCFWTDVWVGNETLENVCLRHLSKEERKRRLVDYWKSNTGWKQEEISGILAEESIQLLGSILVDDDTTNEDRMIWLPSAKGMFDCKSAINLINDHVECAS